VSWVNIEHAVAYTIIARAKALEFVVREVLDSSFRLLILRVAEKYTSDDLRLDVRWKERNGRVHDSGSLANLMLVGPFFFKKKKVQS
jgi:hypothetical protein